MSYDYKPSVNDFLRASLLFAVCLPSTAAAADTTEAPSAAEMTTKNGLKISPIIHRSRMAVDPGLIQVALEEFADPTTGSADVTVEDADDGHTQKLVVRLYKKDSYSYMRKVLVLRDGIPVRSYRDRSTRCDPLTCVAQLRENAKCPDFNNIYDAVFATPEVGTMGDRSSPAIAAINSAKASVEANPNLAANTITGKGATPQDYFNWLVCPKVRFFGSIAPIDPETGDIALADGGSLPRDWFTAFRATDTVLSGKVLFFNSDSIANSNMPASALADAKVRTFISPFAELVPSAAAQVFSCFWKEGLTKASLWRFPGMGTTLRSCEGRHQSQGVYYLGGDDGPLLPDADPRWLDVNVPHRSPFPVEHPAPLPAPRD